MARDDTGWTYEDILRKLRGWDTAEISIPWLWEGPRMVVLLGLTWVVERAQRSKGVWLLSGLTGGYRIRGGKAWQLPLGTQDSGISDVLRKQESDFWLWHLLDGLGLAKSLLIHQYSCRENCDCFLFALSLSPPHLSLCASVSFSLFLSSPFYSTLCVFLSQAHNYFHTHSRLKLKLSSYRGCVFKIRNNFRTVYACTSRIWEAEAAGLPEMWGQACLHNDKGLARHPT